jgi:hypothetical protein
MTNFILSVYTTQPGEILRRAQEQIRENTAALLQHAGICISQIAFLPQLYNA